VIVHVLILWGVLALAAALALVVHRRRRQDEGPEFGSALSFVGASYGLLLGLLVSFAVGHYNDVRSQAQMEASSFVSLYDAVAVYPPATRDPVRHQVFCYMRSIIYDDWPSMEQGNQLQAPRTLRLGDELRASLQSLPTNGSTQSTAYGRAASTIADADQSRQRLLFLTAPEIPTALWVVIYAGAFLVLFLLALHYATRPPGRPWALGATIVLMTVVVGVLAALDQPFTVGVQVHPDQMQQAVNLVLADETNPTILAPCH
jgi:hypothetical protein